MGLINGVTTEVARGYLATLTVTNRAEKTTKETITGKELPASVVVISPEARVPGAGYR